MPLCPLWQDVTPEERREAAKSGLDLPSDPHTSDDAQEDASADGAHSADKEVASLQEELTLAEEQLYE